MILSLNKKNSLRSDSFLFLTLQSHNFLTLFLRGGRDHYEEQRFDQIPKSAVFQLKAHGSEQKTIPSTGSGTVEKVSCPLSVDY